MNEPHLPPHPELAVFGVAEVPTPRTLVDIFTTTVDTHPTVTAVIGTDGELTYRQLNDRIADQVDRLAVLGVGRGDRVGIRVPSGTTDLYVAILSTLVAGAAYVPVDWDDPDSRAETVWEEAAVSAVYGENLSLTAVEVTKASVPAAPTTEDDAWIIFTSGSTGKPKGVAITHRSAAALVDAETRMYLVDAPLGPGDRVMAGLSVGFDASCEEMWLAWRYGATLVAAPRDVVRSGDALGAWIIDNGITAVSTVPTLASFWPAEALERIRLLIFGGEALPAELIERLSADGRELWNTYGPTETTVIATGHLARPGEKVRIGHATPGWELVVVDPDTEEPVAWGETGELIVGGVGLGRYLDPAKDAEAYAPLPSMGWERAYRTGDLVVAEPEGLVFAGRADDQIKFAGRRMELVEIDRALATVPGVRAAAAATQRTPAGADVIVGYLVADELDLSGARRHLAEVLPGGIAPVLCEVDELPMKSSGKVDRRALPWPLPDTDSALSDLSPELHWMADHWTDQLGPVPLTDSSDYFDLGGSSVAVAKLAADLRSTRPAVDIGALYDNPTLEEMASYVASLPTVREHRPTPAPIPWWSGVVQFLVVCAIYVVNAARYVVGSLFVVWALDFFVDAGWVPHVPLWPVLIGWFVLFSLPGRVAQGALVSRLLTVRIQPGTYLRGGGVHLRIWAAERFLTYLKLEPLLGTPMTPLLYRLLGNHVGSGTDLHSMPPVTGMAVIGDDVSVEPEVDLCGHWIDGDTLHVGTMHVGFGARLGLRTFVSPGAVIAPMSEILPGSKVTADSYEWDTSGMSWPTETPDEAVASGAVTRVAGLPLRLAYSAGLAWISLLPALAVIPGALLVLPWVVEEGRYEDVFPVLAMWTPVFTLLTIGTWLGLVILTVRACSLFIRPGYFPVNSETGVALWMTHVLLQKTLTSTYFMYAGAMTPAFLRLLGARVGEDTEISTVETIPHLTSIGDRCFLADHSMCTASRHRGGWVHVGTTVIGDGAFVGNSGIVGPDRDLPSESLVAVLASTPYHPGRGSSWLGRQARAIPRVHVDADRAHTFNPPPRLKLARMLVESLRLIPTVVAAYL
ncbi:MAG TPA: AMP-binding protein, partial [Candidatus Corynebacterium avicola]|nr:AMP-binding protein [Candidatus Corynebacterium avicola]